MENINNENCITTGLSKTSLFIFIEKIDNECCKTTVSAGNVWNYLLISYKILIRDVVGQQYYLVMYKITSYYKRKYKYGMYWDDSVI